MQFPGSHLGTPKFEDRGQAVFLNSYALILKLETISTMMVATLSILFIARFHIWKIP